MSTAGKHKRRSEPRLFVMPFLERAMGFELTTPTLASEKLRCRHTLDQYAQMHANALEGAFPSASTRIKPAEHADLQ